MKKKSSGKYNKLFPVVVAVFFCVVVFLIYNDNNQQRQLVISNTSVNKIEGRRNSVQSCFFSAGLLVVFVLIRTIFVSFFFVNLKNANRNKLFYYHQNLIFKFELYSKWKISAKPVCTSTLKTSFGLYIIRRN